MSHDTGGADEVRITLAPDADALVRARRFVSSCARRSGLDDERADDVVQAAAELMAVGGRIRQVLALAVREEPDQLTVRVDLAGPASVEVGDEAAGLLNGLSRQWGWRQLPGCTQVWCEVAKRHVPRRVSGDRSAM
ncbi:ATP-binding protein [Kineococcus sp. G2]|uniref:ATP-binding protein n=1 Tax=Kineococcus sp. G2 TaxID=3127484 RepID=UPI00301D25C2